MPTARGARQAMTERRRSRPPAPGRPEGIAGAPTRRPERPILTACASVGIAFALLAVLERMGVDRTILGALAVALPLAGVAVLAVMGRTIDRLPYVVDGARGGALGNGLALGAEWMGVWLVPMIVLVPTDIGHVSGTVLALGSALGLAACVLAFAGPLRRVTAMTLPSFLAWRVRPVGAESQGPRALRIATGLIVASIVCGLTIFQLVLLRALLTPFVGASADATLLGLIVLAALTLLIGGQRSLTLVNAFLAFFLILAMVVPALAAIGGVEGLTAALPVDRGFALALPGMSGGGFIASLMTFVALALATLALPTLTTRLSGIRPGGVAESGAWAMLAGYVAMTAATLAFARAALTPGLTVSAYGETSILSVLPALGWLGAVWAGFSLSLFALGSILGMDTRLHRSEGQQRRHDAYPGWADPRAVIVMRLLFIAAPVAVWWFGAETARWFNVQTAGHSLSWVVVASGGILAPCLVAGTLLRRIGWPCLLAGQAAGLLFVWLLWGTLSTGMLTVLTAIATCAAVAGVDAVTPRKWCADAAVTLTVRDP